MKKLLVTVKPFQGTIPFRILQRGRVLVEGSFSGKCTQLHSRTFQVNATNEELTVECTMNAAKCRMVKQNRSLHPQPPCLNGSWRTIHRQRCRVACHRRQQTVMRT
ncbi:hypothetical protein BvCmsKKP067_02272 [Escherichia coli]|nr:hypothetical protein BvCmsKKP067_02272 [Escherichia coli]